MEELRVCGDMLGDKIVIGESHEIRTDALFPELISLPPKSVVAVGGPSGSGKSEIASLIGTRFIKAGRNAYVVSCDNYPHRPPRDNERHREFLFAQKGDASLREYLGTENETNFERLSAIVQDFKSGVKSLELRIMDCGNNRVHDDRRVLDVSNVDVLVLEGTWSSLVEGSDVRIFLSTNFRETLEHRKKRARDPLTPFGEKVLTLEQEKLEKIRDSIADIVITPTAQIVANRLVGEQRAMMA